MGTTMDVDAPTNRFKHKSYNDSLREVHLPSALAQTELEHKIGENGSQFYESLQHWKQLNLSPSFLQYANLVEPLSASMPLLLHNWRDIVKLWLDALASSNDEGLKPLLDLMQNLAHDLRTTLSPMYPDILARLLKLLTRSISAASLSTLLATFSSLFKFLLVPLIHFDLLETTWAAMSKTLRQCIPEVQRAVAEVWGSVLRRLKATGREKAVQSIANDLEGLEDASAWCLVFACKSVSQTLHTSTLSLLSPLISLYSSASQPDTLYTLIRRLITALIHHVKNAEQFTPLGDYLVTLFLESSKAADTEEEQERLRRSLELIGIPCAVRQGSRLTEKHLSSIANELANNAPRLPGLHHALGKVTAATLLAGEMGLWLGPGRKLLESSWSDPAYAIKLHGALADLGWGGWKSLALPNVLKQTPNLLQNDPHNTIHLLSVLHRDKRLGEVDLVWKQRFNTWASGQLRNWELTGDAVMDLTSLSSIDNVDDETMIASRSRVVGVCLQALAKRNPQEWKDRLDLVACTRRCVARWADSEWVLGGLDALWTASGISSALPLDEVYHSLNRSILSHSRALRLHSLRLLSSPFIQSSTAQREVLKRCLQGEEVPLDMQGVRERVLRIGRLSQLIRDDDELVADICVRWLLAQLKVNLRPLWSPATGALATLSDKFGSQIWAILLEELTSLVSTTNDTRESPGENQNESEADDPSDPWEEEKMWRDPSAHKMRGVMAQWMNEDWHRTGALTRAQTPNARFDRQSYEVQLLSCLSECHRLAEKHNKDLVPLFLSFSTRSTGAKPSRTKLAAWLTLFSKFSNPKALYATEALHSVYTVLLSHPDRTLQTLALSCILTYKSPHLTPHEDEIKSLLDVTRWRDALTNLDLSTLEGPARTEVINIITRLLFGIMLEKKGRSRGADRRAAVLGTLASCTDEELYLLVDLMLHPTTSTSLVPPMDGQSTMSLSEEKQQLGFLTLLGDVLKNLGSRLVAYWPMLLSETIAITARAHSRLTSRNENEEIEIDDDAEEEEDEEEASGSSTSKNTRLIRQTGLKRFADFFRQPVSFDFTSYMKGAFESFISPRIDDLDKENIQAPSALLELFFTWTLQRDYVPYLISFDNRLIPSIYNCLVAKNVKTSVIMKIFDIIDRLLVWSSDDDTISASVVIPHMSLLLGNMAVLAERTSGNKTVATPLGQREIHILSQIAPYCRDQGQASRLLKLFIPSLRKPTKVVPETVKVDLVKIIYNIMPMIPELAAPSDSLSMKTYEMLSQLFQTLRSRQGRLAIVQAFHRFASIDTTLQDVAAILTSLNSYSPKRIEEPNFERRLEAFNLLNETVHGKLSCRQWLPLLYNSLYFIQDPTELSIRSNASYALRRFIDQVAEGENVDEFQAGFLRMLYPGLKNGLRSKNEMVRAEILGVLSYAVDRCTRIASLQEMRILLAGGDEEANFFNNVLHVQFHRRSRALRRLAEICEAGHIRSSTLNEIFVPLVANFIVSTSTLDHHLVNDAISTTGRMAKHLLWGAYYALVQKYLKLTSDKDEAERVYVRTLVAILESFHFPMDEAVAVPQDVPEAGLEDGDDEHPLEEPSATQATAITTKVADAVQQRLLPRLLSHLEKRDPTTEDGSRIPIALGIVQVAQHLPSKMREPQVSRLLTILSQILRSRSQETRDLTRDTINRIAITLGPASLPTLLRELRAALLRGPQLHVLAYTTHSLLVRVTSDEHSKQFEVLDSCVTDVAHIATEVVFGESGKDVQSEDFKTKMREVRASSSKGLDSFMIMAKHIRPSAISGLLAPLRSIMHETESLKVMNQVDEVLKRIVSGLNANQHLVPAELLVLCHTLITQNANFLNQAPAKRKAQTKDDVIVQTKRQIATDADHYSNNAHRFVAFGLDLFNTALKRGRFDFKDRDIMSRLGGMIVAVGNTLYSTDSPVLVLGLKAVAGLVKCPSKVLEESLPVFIRQVLDIIKRTGSTESEVVQVAFKSLATILRDGPAVHVQEKDLVYLLELLGPDLEEPTRQASVFAMLRAIVGRKFVVPEIYDAMDKVSEVMVTSQSAQVQELCRSVILQFLLDYPQGKGRLRNHMTFLAKNLSYVYDSGRKSVMELLGAVITKFDQKLIIEYADLLFVSLVMVIANDDSAKCREMASQLIKSLILRLDEERRKVMMSHLHAWVSQQSQVQLIRVSLQVYGLVVDIMQADLDSQVSMIYTDISGSLQYSTKLLQSVTEEADMDIDLDWQVPYHSLVLLEKVLRIFPSHTTDGGKVPWDTITTLLLFPHAWVRTASCRLLGMLFNVVPAGPPSSYLPTATDAINIFSVSGSKKTAEKLCVQLKSEHLDEALSLQVVKNLFYLGKCFAAMPLADEVEREEEDESSVRASPLPWLFSKLSYQIKSAHIARRNKPSAHANWTQQPLAILKWFAAMTSHLDADKLERFLVHILTPMYRIQDEDTIRDEKLEELKTVASELQDLVQSKVGVTKFSTIYQQIRQGALDVRRDRKATRAIQATIHPDLAAKRRTQRNIAKKESKKRKTQSFPEHKGKMKRRRQD
ncbi:U3 snoRNP protein [Pleurotus pulmonarius]|nr:U3 snoRNP protein [Pleurotus pulmonarius]